MPVANPLAKPLAKPQHSQPERGGVGIIVFARPPVAGRCKTRLASGLGARRAALIYRAMLMRAVDQACRVAPGRVTISCAAAASSAFFAYLARRHNVTCVSQRRGDLGQRMHAAARWGLGRHDAVVLMGSDQPDFGDMPLARAVQWLADSGQHWLAPTIDGGYWAIGLNEAPASVFRGPRWSSRDVAGRTRTSMARLAMAWQEAPIRRDVDTAGDWARLDRATRTAVARVASLPGLANRS